MATDRHAVRVRKLTDPTRKPRDRFALLPMREDELSPGEVAELYACHWRPIVTLLQDHLQSCETDFSTKTGKSVGVAMTLYDAENVVRVVHCLISFALPAVLAKAMTSTATSGSTAAQLVASDGSVQSLCRFIDQQLGAFLHVEVHATIRRRAFVALLDRYTAELRAEWTNPCERSAPGEGSTDPIRRIAAAIGKAAVVGMAPRALPILLAAVDWDQLKTGFGGGLVSLPPTVTTQHAQRHAFFPTRVRVASSATTDDEREKVLVETMRLLFDAAMGSTPSNVGQRSGPSSSASSTTVHRDASVDYACFLHFWVVFSHYLVPVLYPRESFRSGFTAVECATGFRNGTPTPSHLAVVAYIRRLVTANSFDSVIEDMTAASRAALAAENDGASTITTPSARTTLALLVGILALSPAMAASLPPQEAAVANSLDVLCHWIDPASTVMAKDGWNPSSSLIMADMSALMVPLLKVALDRNFSSLSSAVAAVSSSEASVASDDLQTQLCVQLASFVRWLVTIVTVATGRSHCDDVRGGSSAPQNPPPLFWSQNDPIREAAFSHLTTVIAQLTTPGTLSCSVTTVVAETYSTVVQGYWTAAVHYAPPGSALFATTVLPLSHSIQSAFDPKSAALPYWFKVWIALAMRSAAQLSTAGRLAAAIPRTSATSGVGSPHVDFALLLSQCTNEFSFPPIATTASTVSAAPATVAGLRLSTARAASPYARKVRSAFLRGVQPTFLQYHAAAAQVVSASVSVFVDHLHALMASMYDGDTLLAVRIAKATTICDIVKLFVATNTYGHQPQTVALPHGMVIEWPRVAVVDPITLATVVAPYVAAAVSLAPGTDLELQGLEAVTSLLLTPGPLALTSSQRNPNDDRRDEIFISGLLSLIVEPLSNMTTRSRASIASKLLTKLLPTAESCPCLFELPNQRNITSLHAVIFSGCTHILRRVNAAATSDDAQASALLGKMWEMHYARAQARRGGSGPAAATASAATAVELLTPFLQQSTNPLGRTLAARLIGHHVLWCVETEESFDSALPLMYLFGFYFVELHEAVLRVVYATLLAIIEAVAMWRSEAQCGALAQRLIPSLSGSILFHLRRWATSRPSGRGLVTMLAMLCEAAVTLGHLESDAPAVAASPAVPDVPSLTLGDLLCETLSYVELSQTRQQLFVTVSADGKVCVSLSTVTGHADAQLSGAVAVPPLEPTAQRWFDADYGVSSSPYKLVVDHILLAAAEVMDAVAAAMGQSPLRHEAAALRRTATAEYFFGPERSIVVSEGLPSAVRASTTGPWGAFHWTVQPIRMSKAPAVSSDAVTHIEVIAAQPAPSVDTSLLALFDQCDDNAACDFNVKWDAPASAPIKPRHCSSATYDACGHVEGHEAVHDEQWIPRLLACLGHVSTEGKPSTKSARRVADYSLPLFTTGGSHTAAASTGHTAGLVPNGLRRKTGDPTASTGFRCEPKLFTVRVTYAGHDGASARRCHRAASEDVFPKVAALSAPRDREGFATQRYALQIHYGENEGTLCGSPCDLCVAVCSNAGVVERLREGFGQCESPVCPVMVCLVPHWSDTDDGKVNFTFPHGYVVQLVKLKGAPVAPLFPSMPLSSAALPFFVRAAARAAKSEAVIVDDRNGTAYSPYTQQRQDLHQRFNDAPGCNLFAEQRIA